MPRISYIVSACNRTEFLPCCLHSLNVQTDQDFEVIVADNSTDAYSRQVIRQMTKAILGERGRYINTGSSGCYSAANMMVPQALGDYVCFPSDDGYYMPVFGEVMYRTAVESRVDWVICDMVYDPRREHNATTYGVSEQHPRRGWFDKGGFIIRRPVFRDFPPDVDFPPRTGPVLDSPDGL